MAAPVLQQPASLSIHCTNDSARSMLPHEEPCQRKRRRDQSTCEDIEEQPSAKRRKAASYNYPPEFWNALSKITLTRKALKEFNRRTTKEKITPVVGAVKRLTRLLKSDTKRLLCFAKNGGPNLNHLRGYADLQQAATSMSKSNSRTRKRTRDSGLPSSKATNKTSTTGPYDAQFQQMLIDNSIYPKGYRMVDGSKPPKPNNVDSIIDQLQRQRRSMSPSQFSESAFEDFQDRNDRAQSESESISGLISFIAGRKDYTYEAAQDKVFNNLEKFAPSLTAPKPDKYYGAHPIEIHEIVRHDLDKYIIPSTNTSLPAVPNFFFEGKSAAGRPDVAQRQVMHDNAYGARGMFQLQNYGKETPVYDGNAYTIGSSYHPGTGTLQMYATHPRQSASGGTEYYITQLRSFAMTDTSETFRQGTAAYRNSRDFTQDKRDQFITDANTVAQRQPIVATPSSGTGSRTNLSSVTVDRSFDSDTSTDELALGYTVSFANHDLSEPERYGRPHKRVAKVNASTSDVHAKNRRSQLADRKAQDDKADGSSGSDENFLTAEEEEEEEDDDDNDDDDDGDVDEDEDNEEDEEEDPASRFA